MTESKSQLTKFIAVGSLAALTHGLLLYTCVSVFLINPVWSNVIAFSIAFIVSFLGHSWLTFRKNITHIHTSGTIKRLSKWFISSLFGFVLNQGLFMLGLAWFGDEYYLLIWFVVTGIVTVSSFLLGKLWAFKT